MRCRGCARLAAWAGRLPSRGLHVPLVRLCSWVLLVGRHSAQLGGDACHVGTDIRARPSNCAETLKASGTVLGWRIPRTPCGSMGMKSRWLEGITQPSRLTCWVHSADIPPAESLPCSRCTQGMSWQRPTSPLSFRGNQALAAGSETRRRSVDGRVCLRNSPRPCDSRSHLSGPPSVNVGLAPPAWQWSLGGEVVKNKHLSIGSI